MAEPQDRFVQRAIYDQRYRGVGYDQRSAVRVLTAEKAALDAAVLRALRSVPSAAALSIVDFGYGTGRVTNEFIGEYVSRFAPGARGLRVIAHDVSSVGLQKAAAGLAAGGFSGADALRWRPDGPAGYIAGSIMRIEESCTLTVTFVHGSEADAPSQLGRLLESANHGEPALVTTSWYSGLGHVPGRTARAEIFAQLGEVTHPRGEIVIAVASTGDVPDLQQEWSARLVAGQAGGWPIEAPGDVLYETELGQQNFCHVFGEDLNQAMAQITTPDQSWWVEGIRFPDEEFTSQHEEQANYDRVRAFNAAKSGRPWRAEDFRRLHTVAGFRSGAGPDQRPEPARA